MGNMMESMKKAQEIAKMSGIINKELMELNVVGNGNYYEWQRSVWLKCLFLSSKRSICHHDATDPAQQVFATYNGMGMPIGIKISDQMATQGGEAVSLACTQAMQDGYKKSQTISKSIESVSTHRNVLALHHSPTKKHYEGLNSPICITVMTKMQALYQGAGLPAP